MLKNLNIVLVLILLLTAVACEDNQPVELVDEATGEGETEIEVNVLGLEADTTGIALAVDTTGLLHSELSRYAAAMIVSGVQFDVLNRHHEVSFAHAVFFDLTDPIRFMGRIIGFPTLDVGKVFLDGIELHQVPHRLRRPEPPFADSLVGVRYGLLNVDGRGDSNFGYQPDHAYEWSIEGSDRIPPRNVSIASPGRVNIIFPQATSSLSKDHPLEILWTGQRPETIIISGVRIAPDEGSRPLLLIRVPKEIRRIIIPAKIVQLLPTDRFERFLFTFKASNTRVIPIPDYSENVLLHATSVHNVLVKIR